MSRLALIPGPMVSMMPVRECPACGGFRAPRRAVCSACYSRLPRRLRNALFDRGSSRYPAALRDAVRFLRGCDKVNG